MRYTWLSLILVLSILTACNQATTQYSINAHNTTYVYEESHPLVESARKQVGVVTKYDVSYYEGGYPPDDRGACTDVIERALRDNGYDLKAKIDTDMTINPERYSTVSDPNINFDEFETLKHFWIIMLSHYPLAEQMNVYTREIGNREILSHSIKSRAVCGI